MGYAGKIFKEHDIVNWQHHEADFKSLEFRNYVSSFRNYFRAYLFPQI